MTTEKLGKAFLVVSGTELENLTGSHAAFTRFARAVSSSRKLQKTLGMKKAQQRAQFKALLPLAYEIERLAPTLAQSGPNPEYPWKDVFGNILAPADFPFPLMQRLHQTPQGIQLLNYIEFFVKRFEELFM
jgi:hypothetical protein